jgi:predicted alpha/beta hydrolase family esterase
MKKAIILHGMPSKEEYYDPNMAAPSNMHWIPWVQRRLLLKDILAQAIELPAPYKPEYTEWLKVFEQFDIEKDTILIAHSCGAGFLVRWLSENNVSVGKVVLVAPWLDPEKKLDTDFFDFDIDPALASKTDDLHIFVSEDDYGNVVESARTIESAIKGVAVSKFMNKGHFTYEDMGSEEFPELLSVI